MDKLQIEGGIVLNGKIRISGAKNAALPLLTAGLICDDSFMLTNVPDLADTRLMINLLRHHGLKISFENAISRFKTLFVLFCLVFSLFSMFFSIRFKFLLCFSMFFHCFLTK